MAIGNATFSEYIHQYLITVTGGGITEEFSTLENRWRLRCHKCWQTLTFLVPLESTEFEWHVQEFIKLYAHKSPLGERNSIVGVEDHPTPRKVTLFERLGRKFR